MMLLSTELEKLWKRPALWIGFCCFLLVEVSYLVHAADGIYRGGHDFRPEQLHITGALRLNMKEPDGGKGGSHYQPFRFCPL